METNDKMLVVIIDAATAAAVVVVIVFVVVVIFMYRLPTFLQNKTLNSSQSYCIPSQINLS